MPTVPDSQPQQDRGVFPDGVVLQHRDLAFESRSRAFHIHQRFKDSSSLGVASGLVVSVSTADATRVDLSAGHGYTPSGAFVEIEENQTAIPLSNGASGTINLVVLVYTETEILSRAHEATGVGSNTRAVSTSRLRVYTQAQFDALSLSSDDLSRDAQDRCLICGRISALGAGIVLQAGAITNASDISELKTIEQTTITGLEISSLDQTAALGTAVLEFTPTPGRARWKAPGELNPGAYITLVQGNEHALVSSAGKTLKVVADLGAVPAVASSQNLAITKLYSQDVSRHVSVDGLLRTKRGTGVPRVSNPHGLAFKDLTGVIDTKGNIKTKGDFTGKTFKLQNAKTRIIVVPATQMVGETVSVTGAALASPGPGAITVVIETYFDFFFAGADGPVWRRQRDTGAGDAYVSFALVLPNGASLDRVRIHLNKTTATTAALTVARKLFGSGTVLVLGSGTAGGAGQVTVSATLSPVHVVDSENYSYVAYVTVPAQGDYVHAGEYRYSVMEL